MGMDLCDRRRRVFISPDDEIGETCEERRDLFLLFVVDCFEEMEVKELLFGGLFLGFVSLEYSFEHSIKRGDISISLLSEF